MTLPRLVAQWVFCVAAGVVGEAEDLLSPHCLLLLMWDQQNPQQFLNLPHQGVRSVDKTVYGTGVY